MKRKLLLFLLLVLIILPTAVSQQDVTDQEKRLIRVEVTMDQMDQRLSIIEANINRIDGRLDTLIMWVVGLLAASFISIFVLILQIKTQLIEMNAKFEAQLIEMNAKFGLLQKDVSTLNEKVDGLEQRIDGLEEQVNGVEHRIGSQLNQIQKALAKQLGMDIDNPRK